VPFYIASAVYAGPWPWGISLLGKILHPSEKYVGYNLKLLDIVQKIWAALKKLLSP